MRNLLLISLALIVTNILWSQEVCFEGYISRDYKKAIEFHVVDIRNNQKITFRREKKNKLILFNDQSLVLFKRKILLKGGDTLITVLNRKKYKLSTGEFVVREKVKNGWKYLLEDRVVLEITYIYNQEVNSYALRAISEENSDAVLNLILLNLGRIDKNIQMDNDFDDVFWAAIQIVGGIFLH